MKSTKRDLRNAERQIKGTQFSLSMARLSLRGADDVKLLKLARELEGIRVCLAAIRLQLGRERKQMAMGVAA